MDQSKFIIMVWPLFETRKLSCTHGVQSDVLLDNSELKCRGHVMIREPSVVVNPVIFHSLVCSKTAL